VDFSHGCEGFVFFLEVAIGTVCEDLFVETGDHEFGFFAEFKGLGWFCVGFLTENVDEGGEVGASDIVVFEVLSGLVFPLEGVFELLEEFRLVFESLVKNGGVLRFLRLDSALFFIGSFFGLYFAEPESFLLLFLLFFESFLFIFLLFFGLLDCEFLEFLFGEFGSGFWGHVNYRMNCFKFDYRLIYYQSKLYLSYSFIFC
jgi:hypothetical protein